MKYNLTQAIEAILFSTAEPQTFNALAKILEVEIEEIATAVTELSDRLKDHGISIVELNEVVSIVTDSKYSDLIEKLRKEEISRDLSKASAETLAVITYSPGISKNEIEFIRGVNSAYSLRALQMRGLVEQRGVGRSTGYHPTIDLLEHYGISKIEDLPLYEETKSKLVSLLKNI